MAASSSAEKKFSKRLSALSKLEDPDLRQIWKHYHEDFIIILREINIQQLLCLLNFEIQFETESHEEQKEQWGTVSFAIQLLKDISDLGKAAVFGFWKCLYKLQKCHPYPNVRAFLQEIIFTDEKVMVEESRLDLHDVPEELKDIQEEHKQHLLKGSQYLVEYKPPQSTLKEKKYLISDRYVNLVVVSTDQFRQRPQNELIQTGIKHEELLKEVQTGLEHISPNRLFRWSPQSQCKPHAVMVSGVPGIGKTTMMQKFVYDWVTGKLYQRFAFVFFYRFRELNSLLGEVTLRKMILHKYQYLEGHLENILQHPDKLLFIFDGLDESIHQMDFTSGGQSSHPQQKEDVGVIVVSLVRQSLLKGCSVVITSRPTRLASVDTHVFKRVTEILGFLSGDRLVYFENFFRKKELSEFEKAFRHVQENDTLYTFCYIPAYCWIICTVLSMCYGNQPANSDQLVTPLPKTVTQLFVAFVSNNLANHNQNRDEPPTALDNLMSIGWMAEHGVMNHMIVFDKRDLKSFNVTADKHLLSCFMAESGLPPDVDYSFLHLTLQEFVAALVHFISYDPDKLAESLNKADSYEDGRAEIFLRFLSGLSDKSTGSMLKSYVGELSPEASRQVISWLQHITKETINDKHKLLNVFYCLYESRNKALVSQCVGSHNLIDFSSFHLSPLDCSVVAFILKSCKETEAVKLHRCHIQDEGLRKLAPVLNTIKDLSFGYNNLTFASCPHLASGIRNNQTLRKLDLYESNLGGPEFNALKQTLPTSQLDKVFLQSPGSSSPDLSSRVIKKQELRKLDQSYNKLAGPKFHDLMEALPTSRIEELNLGYNNLPPSCCPHLASGIRNNQTLRKLNLDGNRLGGPEFSDLMEALPTSRIEELVLRNNDLTYSSCLHLASGIRNNQTLRWLDLFENKLGGDEFCVLMEALPTSRIEELRLTSNNVPSSCCPHLASGIRNNQTLKKLILYYNELGGDEFRDLMEALPTSRIEELDLSGNNVPSSDVCRVVASGIRNNQTLRNLNLSRNNLPGDGFGDLMEALPTSRIEELDLCAGSLSFSSCPHLASGIRNNQTLRKLNLSTNKMGGPGFSDLVEALKTSHIMEIECKSSHVDERNFSKKAKQQLRDLMLCRPNMKIVMEEDDDYMGFYERLHGDDDDDDNDGDMATSNLSCSLLEEDNQQLEDLKHHRPDMRIKNKHDDYSDEDDDDYADDDEDMKRIMAL